MLISILTQIYVNVVLKMSKNYFFCSYRHIENDYQ